MRRNFRIIVFMTIGLLVLGESARAGVLAGQPTIYGPGTPRGVPSGETVVVNNDNVEANNPNRISLTGIDITGFAPVDIRIPVANSPTASGTTEYLLTLGTAANLTDSAWKGFVLELGNGIGSEFLRLGLRPLVGVSGLDFDTPHRDPGVTSPSFASVVHEADRLSFSGGAVPVGQVASAQNFSIDIPDITQPGDPNYRFTIRLRPISVLSVKGDFDQDGDVDVSDFMTWQRNPALGQLSDWRTNYGATTSLAANSTAVPEPMGMFVMIGAAMLLPRRRRHQAQIASAPTATPAR